MIAYSRRPLAEDTAPTLNGQYPMTAWFRNAAKRRRLRSNIIKRHRMSAVLRDRSRASSYRGPPAVNRGPR